MPYEVGAIISAAMPSSSVPHGDDELRNASRA